MGLDKPYEYYYWSDSFNDLTGETSPELSAWQVGNMTGKAYSHYGLKETYNGKMLYMSRFIFELASYREATMQSFDLTEKELYNFLDTMNLLTEQVTLGGPDKLYSVQDIIFGY